MLQHHLDDASDVSSRNARFIETSAAWIVSHFCLGKGSTVADYGCGPGLYTSRFAAAGAEVTGIDFSERSLAYARERARADGLRVDYVRADYLGYASAKRFDLVTIIMCDYCALGPERRRVLLEAFRRQVKREGALLLDVYSHAAFEARRESSSWARGQLDGFWSPAPYFGFLSSFKYEAEKVALDKYTIVEESRTRVVYNWYQHFSPASLTAELEAGGFQVEELLGDVGGSAYDPSSPEFAVVARRDP
jgi:SAM-dependent methyltransferase